MWGLGRTDADTTSSVSEQIRGTGFAGRAQRRARSVVGADDTGSVQDLWRDEVGLRRQFGERVFRLLADTAADHDLDHRNLDQRHRELVPAR